MASTNPQNQINPQAASELASSNSTNATNATNLPERISYLESELRQLKKVLLKGNDLASHTHVSLDLELQRQVLMLTEAMPHMVFIADCEGRTIHANNRFYEFTGLNRQDDDGWAWTSAIHPDDLKAAIEAGNEAALSNRSFSIELRCNHKSGSYAWHLMHIIPLYDPDTNSTKWYGTATNIQEQKQTQENLAESESQLRTLADAIPHIVFAANPDGSVYFWNHRWFEYSGLTAEQSQSAAWTLLIHPQYRDKYLSEWEKALNSGDTFEFEFRLKRAVGISNMANPGYLWHLARAVAMQDNDGRIVRWFGTWTEIEGQKRTEPLS